MKKFILLLTLAFTSCFMFSQTTDVWDFGATQLNNSQFNNQLNETVINDWYLGTTPGTTGVNFPTSFTAGALSWFGNASDRLRTTNTNLTRFDNNVAGVSAYTGRIYCNGTVTTSAGLPNSRYLKLVLAEDDEVNIIARGDTDGLLTFVKENNPNDQTDTWVTPSASGQITDAKFVAKTAGTYRIYDQSAKASFYRVTRKDALYSNVSGSIDLSQAINIPSVYSLIFTNLAGKSWTAKINDAIYQVTIPLGYTYQLSLLDASGYIISSGEVLDLTTETNLNVNHQIAISNVVLFTVSGNIIGLSSNINNLNLNFVPDPASGTIFQPSPIIDVINSTYSVQLEANITYTVNGIGVNDFEILNNTLNIPAENNTIDIVFSPKPVYEITTNITGLDSTQLNDLQLTFTNINETDYVYTFSYNDTKLLRNGTYQITANGLDMYAVQLGLTSNLLVSDQSASKNLTFNTVTVWSFNDQTINSTTIAYYKGLQLNGQITTVTSSGHLTAKTGSSIIVPIQTGQKLIVTYYYTANFMIEGIGPFTTNSNSTSVIENAEYVYTGSDNGFVTIQIGGVSNLTSYFPEIKVVPNTPFQENITVGVDKQYQTINAALQAVSYMVRPNNERVNILIDPANYEEMLVINLPNITLKNASSNPSIQTLNGGLDIDANAARITSYYGHGYNYYSMGSDNKWNQEVLNVSLENGFPTHNNAGAGTTNGSFWNATVVVRASGFEAEHIIFENSFNQYISQKESQDVVLPWSSGSPGVRPNNFGNLNVQQRTLVERAAAIAFPNNTDKAILKYCSIIGRQDTFFGGNNSRVVVFRGEVMGAVDFIFGGMTAVFYKTKLTMNVSDASNDVSYITAAQQTTGRGYLMFECTVTSTNPNVNTNSTFRAKPGYFGRPWSANTSEVVFFNTTIETSNFTGSVGNSLILPLGWQNTLGGTSSGMYEFGTIEESGVNNTPFRATWSTSLTNPILNDGTVINTFNFTKGNDDWDPLPLLIASDPLSTHIVLTRKPEVFSIKNNIYIQNIYEETTIEIFDLKGSKVKSLNINQNALVNMPKGMWIVVLKSNNKINKYKIITFCE